MTKISALSDIGTSVAANDVFVLVDVSDPTTPNKKIQQQNLFLVPDGNATTPGIRFLSDTNTGLFRATTDTLAFATNGSERLRISSTGLVGIGTTSPGQALHVVGKGRYQEAASSGAIAFIGGDATAAYIDTGTYSGVQPLAFRLEGTERARIDSSGRLLVGTSAARSVYANNQQFEVEGTSIATSSGSFVQNSNDANGPRLILGKSRGTAVGSNTIVQNNDNLGIVAFAGADGTDLATPGATIAAAVDGTPGADDLPTRLVFSVTADGASSPTERMRIDSRGAVRTGNNTLYTGTTGAVTASTGTIVFSFDFSGTTTRHTALVKLAAMHLVATNDIAAQPAAEYVFAVEAYTNGVCAATAPTAVFQNVYVAATHFSFASTGNTSFTVTLTNPSASAASAVYYKVEVLDNASALNMTGVTTT